MPIFYTSDNLPTTDQPTSVLLMKTFLLAAILFGTVHLILGVIFVGW